MHLSQRSFFKFARVFVFSFVLLLPVGTQAAGLFSTDPIFPVECKCDGQVGPNGETLTTAPDYGCVLQVIQNVINFAISLGTLLAVFYIAWAGVRLVLSPTNAAARSKAKDQILNAVIGTVLILCAWLIVDFVMKTFYDGDKTFGPWNSILADTGDHKCVVAKNPTSIATDVIGIVTGAPNSNGGIAGQTTGTGTGSCKVPTSANNACSVQNLNSTCFASLGASASAVCMLESAGGKTAVLSGSDKLGGVRGPSYSVGLWQINLTTADISVEGKSCRKAFSGPCSGSAIRGNGKVGWCSQRVVDQDLYQKCVAAAQNPQINSQAACSLYTARNKTRGATVMADWKCSASRCQVPGASTLSGTCAPGNT